MMNDDECMNICTYIHTAEREAINRIVKLGSYYCQCKNFIQRYRYGATLATSMQGR